ncbi:MAG: hypothetical protein JF591_10755 [Lysobacter sp.]|nr:hypothetical protein [Lysobacter sp.]
MLIEAMVPPVGLGRQTSALPVRIDWIRSESASCFGQMEQRIYRRTGIGKHEGGHEGESAIVVAKCAQSLAADSPVHRIEAPQAGHPKTSRHGTAVNADSARPGGRHFSAGPGELRYDCAAGERKIARNPGIQGKIPLRECAAVAPRPMFRSAAKRGSSPLA